MALERQGGRLIEVTEEQSMQTRLDAAPITPLATALKGGTAKQVDMAGTPLQKKPILEQRVAKEATLGGVERLAQAQQISTQAQQATAERAAQIQQLGSLGVRVQDQVQQQFESVAQQQAEAQIKISQLSAKLGLTEEQEAAAKADPNSTYNQITSALQAFVDSGDVNAAEEALVALTQLGMSTQDAKDLIDTSAAALGITAAETISDKITLGQLDVTQLGYESAAQLAGLLGVEESELNDMTVPQLEKLVTQVQQQEFNNIQIIKAQLAALPPGSFQREILMRELRNMGAVGVTGLEAEIKETIEDLEMADKVQIGDQMFDAEDLLKDEEISRLIQDWVAADPEERETIFPSGEFPELTAWLDANQLALGELSNTFGERQEQFDTTQEEFSKMGTFEDIGVELNKDVISTFLPGYDPDIPLTTAQFQELSAQWSASPIGSITSNVNNEWDKTEIESFMRKANDLSIEDRAAMENLSAEDIMNASNTADILKFDTVGLKDFLGMSGQEGMIFDQDMINKVEEYNDPIKAMSEAGMSRWLEEDYISSLSGADMTTIMETEDPEASMEDIKVFNDTTSDIEEVESMDDVMDIVFQDSTIDWNGLTEEYDNLELLAKYGDPSAIEKLAWFKENIDLDGNGNLDDADFELFKIALADATSGVTHEEMLAGGGGAELRELIDTFSGLGDTGAMTFQIPYSAPLKTIAGRLLEYGDESGTFTNESASELWELSDRDMQNDIWKMSNNIPGLREGIEVTLSEESNNNAINDILISGGNTFLADPAFTFQFGGHGPSAMEGMMNFDINNVSEKTTQAMMGKSISGDLKEFTDTINASQKQVDSQLLSITSNPVYNADTPEGFKLRKQAESLKKFRDGLERYKGLAEQAREDHKEWIESIKTTIPSAESLEGLVLN